MNGLHLPVSLAIGDMVVRGIGNGANTTNNNGLHSNGEGSAADKPTKTKCQVD